MSRSKRFSREIRPARARNGARTTLIKRAALVLAVVVLLLAGRRMLNWWFGQMACREFDAGAVSTAQRWLTYSAWLSPRDGTTDVFQATCFRNLGQIEGWREALASAKRKGAPPERIQQESQLGSIQLGLLEVGTDLELSTLVAAAVSPHDVGIAIVHGYLARERPDMARVVLDTWSADDPEAAHTAHMKGVYWCWLGDAVRA